MKHVHPLAHPLARSGASPGTSLDTGLVRSEAGDGFFVVTGAGCLPTRRSFSCLVKPKRGDTVLVASTRDGAYILSVLERAEPGTELIIEDEAVVRAPGLTLASERLGLTGGEVRLTAAGLRVEAVDGDLSFKGLKLFCADLQGCLVKAATTVQDLVTRAGRALFKAGESTRDIRGLDETRAGRSRLTVRGAIFQKSRSATVLAEERVRVDAKKINLG